MVIGVGTDIIEINRIEKAIHKTKSFLDKVYTEREQEYYIINHKNIETLAGFFAAKEAISKALGTGFRSFNMKDIEIVPNHLGKPEVYIYNNAKKLADDLGISKVHISISHCKTYATAFAIAEGGTQNGIINT
ncbi:MAG: holo-ACP synthase [Cellulosilyticum sp.]|nr:holo-ACP synthase [Cellulosilyticum sp.]MEE1073483.1 holo-ACP synthase [Cellulosilyticum sp.]